jgi:hypothetical protein
MKSLDNANSFFPQMRTKRSVDEILQSFRSSMGTRGGALGGKGVSTSSSASFVSSSISTKEKIARMGIGTKDRGKSGGKGGDSKMSPSDIMGSVDESARKAKIASILSASSKGVNGDGKGGSGTALSTSSSRRKLDSSVSASASGVGLTTPVVAQPNSTRKERYRHAEDEDEGEGDATERDSLLGVGNSSSQSKK